MSRMPCKTRACASPPSRSRGLGAFVSSRNKRQVQGVTALMIETSAMLFRKLTALTIMAAAAVALSSASANADQPYTHQDLKSPSEFMSISSPAERSRAIFNRKAADASALHELPSG